MTPANTEITDKAMFLRDHCLQKAIDAGSHMPELIEDAKAIEEYLKGETTTSTPENKG